MKQASEESRYELDLDNRKLIIAFVVLMLVFAGFFVSGFVEGKRQALVSGSQDNGPVSIGEMPAAAPDKEAIKPPDTATLQSVQERSVRDQLDWYKSVKPGSETKPKKSASGDEAKKASTAGGTATPPGSETSTYTVQVGAFRQLQEAEKKGAMLKSKGYAFFIDPPKSPSDFYLLKVGRFDSRATAVEMQLRLKKDGFTTLIKSN